MRSAAPPIRSASSASPRAISPTCPRRAGRRRSVVRGPAAFVLGRQGPHFTDLVIRSCRSTASTGTPGADRSLAYASFSTATRRQHAEADFLLAFVYVPAGKGFADRISSTSRSQAPETGSRALGAPGRDHPRRATGNRRPFGSSARPPAPCSTTTPASLLIAASATLTEPRRQSLAEARGVRRRQALPAGGGRHLRQNRRPAPAHRRMDLRTEQPDTVPLYICRRRDGGDLASNSPQCDGLGTVVSRLGYALRN